MRKEHYLVIALGVALVFALYFFGVTKKSAKEPAAIERQNTFTDYEALQFQKIPEADANRIKELKRALTLQPNFENTLSLSEAWEAIGNYPLGAYYFYKSSELNEENTDWQRTGDKLYNSYKNYSDTLITDNLLTFALASYEKAIKSSDEDIDLRMKLAEVYVESPEPMKGILMLRGIVDSIPDYIPAIMRLGRLSLQTGQFDKAQERFERVLEIDPVNTEAMYFLALTNEGLGNIDQAIRLMEACKNLVQIPEFSQEVDAYINRLKK